jgi:DNA-binding NtrC family response regulator
MLKILVALKKFDPSISALLENHHVDVLPQESTPMGHLAKNSYHLILLEDQIDLIAPLKAIDPRTEVIILGKEKVDTIEAIKHGAAAYFTWPVHLDALKESIDNLHNVVEMRRETAELEKLLTEKYTFAGIVSRNPQMLEIFSLIRRIAPYYRTVLISGETGTGKEVTANALHASSPWAKHPFVVCNCGSLVEGLIESELFGHLKGSFTGAIKDKQGLFEAAGEGTLFLDEIGELPLSFQPHLLRVLQDGDFRRVGSNTPSKARCRIIAATNRNLEVEVAEGRFREDLFFRLTPITIKVPPLRDRKDDLPLLCRVILDRFSKRTGKKVFGISRPAQATLLTYNWMGNVRELENVLERAAILTTEPFIRLTDLPAYFRETPADAPKPMTLNDIEKRHIEAVLQQYNGNRSKSAEILGISRRALIRKIQKLGIS